MLALAASLALLAASVYALIRALRRIAREAEYRDERAHALLLQIHQLAVKAENARQDQVKRELAAEIEATLVVRRARAAS